MSDADDANTSERETNTSEQQARRDGNYLSVKLDEETRQLVEEMKPRYMSATAFVAGTVWQFYGHLGHQDNRQLTPREHVAVLKLKKANVDPVILADAFDVSESTIYRVNGEYQ